MRLRSPLPLAVSLLVLAHVSVAAQPGPGASTPQAKVRRAALDVLRPGLDPSFGDPVEFLDVHLAVRDGWGFVRAMPYSDPWERADRAPDLRLRCDCDPFLYALLRAGDGGTWRVVEQVVRVKPGATPYTAWPARHGVPAALFERDASEVALEAAMREYILAFALDEPSRLLAVLSPGRTLRVVDNSENPTRTTSLSYAKLAGDLRARRGWYRDLFVKPYHPGPGDSYSFYPDYFRESGGRAMWRRADPTTFVSPWKISDSLLGRPYVRWTREEDGRWVLEELGIPVW